MRNLPNTMRNANTRGMGREREGGRAEGKKEASPRPGIGHASYLRGTKHITFCW